LTTTTAGPPWATCTLTAIFGGGTVTDPGLRASDDDRRRIIAALERHTTAGRLSLDEFSERVGLAYTATTHGELARLTRDLPREDAAGPAHPPTGQRQLLAALFLAALTIALLSVVFAALR
jgi:hypothetical protein